MADPVFGMADIRTSLLWICVFFVIVGIGYYMNRKAKKAKNASGPHLR